MIKIGLLLDDYRIRFWEYQMVEKIQAEDCGSIVLLIVNFNRKPKSLAASLIEKWRDKILDWQISDPNAFAPRDIRKLCPNVPVILVEPDKKQYSDYFKEEDIALIKKHQPDLLIRMGFRILRGPILQIAPCGIWSYHHGDNRVNRGGPAGFWETMRRWPVTGSTLQMLTEDLDNGLVLARSRSVTDYFSVNRNRNRLYWKTMPLIPRKLKELSVIGRQAFFQKAKKENERFRFYDRPLYRQPSVIRLFLLRAGHWFFLLKEKIRQWLFFDQWILLYNFQPRGITTSTRRLQKIFPPDDRFWADPCVIYEENNYYIFFEDCKQNRGVISVIKIDKKGQYEVQEKILEQPYHLSHPFVFKWQNSYYLIPETAGNRTIELYQSLRFPGEWQYVTNLMENLYAVDATIHYHRNKWWLFANIKEHDGISSSDELFLFYADRFPTNKWTAHPLNPIVSDPTRARPAGKIFYHNGRLYRPSQNCSHRYGYGLNFNRIIAMTETEYAEKLEETILPLWDDKIQATHAFSHENGLTVIDGQLRRCRFSKFFK